MKRTLALALSLLLTVSLCACGGASMNSAKTESSFDMNYTVSDDAADDMIWAEDSGWAEEPMEEAPSAEDISLSTSQSTALTNAKMIYSADLELETKEFEDAAAALDSAVSALGGYYEARSLYQGGTYRRLSCTIRVPAQNFTAFLEQSGTIAHMTHCNQYSDNISERYYDTEARLTTQRTKLERLHALLEQAATMEDIIELETAISDTELQIEYLTGTLRKYDSLVGFSTVTLELQEVYRLSTDEAPAPLTFSQRLSSAFSTGLERGIEGLEDLAISLARNWMTLLLMAAVVLSIVAILRRFLLKKMTKKKKESAFNDSTDTKS